MLRRMFSLKYSFILGLIISFSKGQHDRMCSVEPKDLLIEEGSRVKIVCRSSCVDGEIFWTLNNKLINESLPINLTHTALLLRNFSYLSATLQCHSSYTNQVLGGTTIKTYSKPKNISCIIHHTNPALIGVADLLTCRWDHQMNPSPEMNYTVLLNFPENPPTEICSSHVTTCTAGNMDFEDFFFGDSCIVTVRAKTAAWEAYSEPFEFKYDHIFKMNPPEVTVKALSGQLMVIRSYPEPPSECQVKYYKSSSSIDEIPKLSFKEEIKIIEVESCVIYKLSVRCAYLEKSPWSEWSPETPVLSKLNEQHVKLLLWRKVAEEGNNGKRKVHLMWMGVPSTCEESVYYTVEQTGGNYTSCGSSACDVEVDQNAHRLFLRVSTDKGVLLKESVYVPAVAESLPQVTDIQTSTHDGIIRVSWKAPVKPKPVSGYIIDWTHDGSQYRWEKITSTNATLSGLLDRKLYNITITPLLDDRTGHSTQARQICSRTGVPETVFIRDVEADDTSAVISWDTKSQNACSSVITFMAFYKPQNGTMLNVTVDGEKREVTLKNLKPSTQYQVSVAAQGHDGKTTSQERFFTTKAFDPRLLMVLSVCGSIVILLLLFLGLCCTIQWKKFKEKPVPNPGLSSVAKWLSQNHQKKVWFFQPFSNQTENLCNPVCTEETQRNPSLAPICSTVSDLTVEYCDPSTILSSDTHDDWSSEPTETQRLSSPEGSTSLLSTERSLVNPYRSQSSVETLMSRTENEFNSDPSKQQDKTTPKSVYVSLNMFEQGNVK